MNQWLSFHNLAHSSMERTPTCLHVQNIYEENFNFLLWFTPPFELSSHFFLVHSSSINDFRFAIVYIVAWKELRMLACTEHLWEELQFFVMIYSTFWTEFSFVSFSFIINRWLSFCNRIHCSLERTPHASLHSWLYQTKSITQVIYMLACSLSNALIFACAHDCIRQNR